MSALKTFTDVYVAGPPCVRFPVLGGRKGEPDAETSTLEMAVRHIELRRPTAFVLENVMGLVTIDGGRVFRTLVARLGVAGHYSVTFGVLNSRNFGVAQSRRRIYIVGVCKRARSLPFVLPDGTGPRAISGLGSRQAHRRR